MLQEDRRPALASGGTTPRVPPLRWLAAAAAAAALVAAVSVVLAEQGATRSRNNTAAATATVQVARPATASPTLAGGAQWGTHSTPWVLGPRQPQVGSRARGVATTT